jgi:hypothetical protein
MRDCVPEGKVITFGIFIFLHGCDLCSFYHSMCMASLTKIFLLAPFLVLYFSRFKLRVKTKHGKKFLQSYYNMLSQFFMKLVVHVDSHQSDQG